MKSPLLLAAVSAFSMLLPLAAQANEAVIRKSLTEKLSGQAKIEEIKLSPMAGLWEVRIGDDIIYTDATGSFLVQGELIDLKTRRNLTEERINKITAVEFNSLPLKDAMVWKSGKGTRRIAVFADPNCGYCKRFERTLQDVKDITVYTFLIPILGGDSPEKSRGIWCAKDPMASYQGWMLEGKAPARSTPACDAGAIDRNLALARKLRVNGTPGIVFEDGSRAPGAMAVDQLERRMQAVGGAANTGAVSAPPGKT